MKLRRFISAIISKFESFNNAVAMVVIITVILFMVFFMVIASYLIQSSIEDCVERSNNKFKFIEAFLERRVAGSDQVLYGLASSLAQERISGDNQRTIQMVHNFDSKFKRHQAIPFSGFKIIDANDLVISHSLIPDSLFKPMKVIYDHALLEAAKEHPFELQLGQIRRGMHSKEKVIPLCMGVNNQAKKYVGAVCSALSLQGLNDQLNIYLTSSSAIRINLSTHKDGQGSLDEYSPEKVLTVDNIFRGYLQNKNLILRKFVPDYNMVIETELSSADLMRRFTLYSFCCFGFMMLFISLTYALILINRRFYLSPIHVIQKRIYSLTNVITSTKFNKANLLELEESGHCMRRLSLAINEVVDYCWFLHSNVEKKELQQPSLKMRSNILHLILTERHYSSSHKSSNKNSGILYLNQLNRAVSEELRTEDLSEFLGKAAEYCCEYYDELNIMVEVLEKDCKEFTFYHSALVETIFHIFTAIIRIGKFNIDDEDLVLKGAFSSGDAFPTIIIEAKALESALHPIGHDLGPSYVYTGLLSAHLLAKENGLFLHIEQKNKKIIFILEPLNSERLQEAENLFVAKD